MLHVKVFISACGSFYAFTFVLNAIAIFSCVTITQWIYMKTLVAIGAFCFSIFMAHIVYLAFAGWVAVRTHALIP
jgi:hypothetical protein